MRVFHLESLLRLAAAPIALFALASAALAQDVPWKEEYQLVISPTPGVAGDPDRYTAAEVLWTSQWALNECWPPQCPAHGYLLEVIPFHTENGSDNCDPETGECPRPLCPATTPFYAQPTPEHHCSGVLIGEDLILTAGHCAAGFAEDCSEQRFIFDYAVKYAGDPLGDPVSFPEDEVFIPFEDVFTCEEVVGFESPFAPGTSPDEAFFAEGFLPTPDWGVMRMTEPVGQERVPLPIERVAETGVGTQALLLGHPARIPLKAEVQPLDVRKEERVSGPFTVLKGNSGSGLVSLGTGKVAGVVVSGAPPLRCSEVCPNNCEELEEQVLDICFSCDNGGSATPTPRFAGSVPAIGLQVTPGLEVHHYGPATTPNDFPWKPFQVSVPAPPANEYGSRDVDWALAHEGVMVMLDTDGPTSGHLEPGDPPETVSFRPRAELLSGPGLWTGLTAFLDQSYGTRTPIAQQIHVGQDGFALTPDEDMVGEGPGVLVYQGVHPRKSYVSTNRWSVPQDVTVERQESWIRVNNVPGPFDVTLQLGPFQSRFATIELNADFTGLAPEVYPVNVTWRSEQSGNPEHELDDVRTIRMDLCRDIFPGAPASFTLPAGQTWELPVLANEPFGYTVKDVDATMHLTSTGGGQHAGLGVALFHPQAGEVQLQAHVNSLATIFDSDVPELEPDESLDDAFEGAQAGVLWKFKVTNGGSLPAEVAVSRIEVRLHTNEKPSCVQ